MKLQNTNSNKYHGDKSQIKNTALGLCFYLACVLKQQGKRITTSVMSRCRVFIQASPYKYTTKQIPLYPVFLKYNI